MNRALGGLIFVLGFLLVYLAFVGKLADLLAALTAPSMVKAVAG